MPGTYIGSKATLAASALTTGDGLVVIDVSAADVRIVEWSDFRGLFVGSPGADPNADRLLFWDDSAGAYAYLTPGANLTITGTTLDATGGASLPVDDSTAIVKGSSDATKQLRFEVDGFTTGTTRVITVPDVSSTMAVLGAQTFSGLQTFSVGIVVGGSDTNITFSGNSNLILGSMLTTNIRRNIIAFNDSVIASQSADRCAMVAEDYAAGDARWRMRSEQGGDVWVGNGAVTGLSTPTQSSDAASKAYVDGLVDDLSGVTNASTARTNLGLGTAATQNTGTSGPTVPLLDGANTWSAAQTVAAALNVGTGSAAGAVASVAPGSGAGNALSLSGSAAVGGNNAGGDVLLVPGAKSGSGADGRVKVRQPGGTPGTHEGHIYHDGTYLVIRNAASSTATLQLLASSTGYASVEMGTFFGHLGGVIKAGLRGNSTFCLGSDIAMVFSSTTDATGSYDASLARVSEGVLRLCGASSTDPGGLSSPRRTPTTLAGDQNDYSPGVGRFQRWSSDSTRTVTGVVAGADGDTRFVWNVDVNDIVLANESASSAAANRFTTSTGANLNLGPKKCALMMYDAGSSRWRVTLLP